jgi:hypothetical protein
MVIYLYSMGYIHPIVLLLLQVYLGTAFYVRLCRIAMGCNLAQR